eukprot:TRINITY_DN7088_c0_g1_i1.p1 TRINITY_DN7088_c0_g1~~TRINITY_DN7088_c0_g1_i1.p1  ORF type:complete len:264 (+),score=49.25 TRINITY_DN7088_c0_g1_i1:285-1076(+)
MEEWMMNQTLSFGSQQVDISQIHFTAEEAQLFLFGNFELYSPENPCNSNYDNYAEENSSDISPPVSNDFSDHAPPFYDPYYAPVQNHISNEALHPNPAIPFPDIPNAPLMQSFPESEIYDWKHVLYNLLVDHHNRTDKSKCLIAPCDVLHRGKTRMGFSVNPSADPKKRFAELFARYIRNASLDRKDIPSPFGEDLYKYYYRSASQLMAKYFTKVGANTYLYDDVPLFYSGETLDKAKLRLKLVKTKERRRKAMAMKGKKSDD